MSRAKHDTDSTRRTASIFAAMLLLFAAPLVSAQQVRVPMYGNKGDKEMGPINDRPPSILNGVGIDQHLNTQLPLNLTRLTVASGLFMFLVLVGMTLSDYFTRAWGRW